MTDAIAKIDTNYIALTGETNIAEMILENLGPGGISPQDLDKIKVPSGGALSWEIPTLDGTEPSKTVKGIIVGAKDVRAYYATDFDGSNNPPDCSSPDALVGLGTPGGPCSSCPMSQWGSKEGGVGQACSHRKMLLILREGSQLPVIISVPPSSLKTLKQYMLRLAGNGLPYYHVITELALVKTKSQGGIDYAQVAPQYDRTLTDDEKRALAAYRTAILPAFDQVAIDHDEA